MQDLLLLIMWALDGIEPQKYCCAHLTIMPRLTFLQWEQLCTSYLQWDHFFRGNQKQIKWLRYVKCWGLLPELTGLMVINLLNNLASNFLNICLKVYLHWPKTRVKRQYSSCRICFITIPLKGLLLHSVFSTLSFRWGCHSLWMLLIFSNLRLVTVVVTRNSTKYNKTQANISSITKHRSGKNSYNKKNKSSSRMANKFLA